MNAFNVAVIVAAAFTAANASPAQAHDSSPGRALSAAEELHTLRGEFSMTMWVEPSSEDGFIAGNPGRAWLSLDGNDIVFTIGGDDDLGGIVRESYSVRARIDRDDRSHVGVSFAADGTMILAISADEGEMTLVLGGGDPAVLEQLDLLEDLIGGVSCSEVLYIGMAPEKCVPTAGNSHTRVEGARAYNHVFNNGELVPRSGY
jgi:hypothetical protein